MNENEVKVGLESLTKDEIIKLFPSLDLKLADKKEFLVEAVLGGEPTEDEKSEFKRLLEANRKAEQPPEAEKNKLEQPPDEKSGTRDREPEIVREPVHRVVYPIKEDGHLYSPGDKYEGENIERFLKGKQIRAE